jgi:hypothetical protein
VRWLVWMLPVLVVGLAAGALFYEQLRSRRQRQARWWIVERPAGEREIAVVLACDGQADVVVGTYAPGHPDAADEEARLRAQAEQIRAALNIPGR